MRLSDRAELIEVMASTIPDDIDLENSRQTSDYLVSMAAVAGYTLSEISRDYDSIVERAAEMRKDRADARAF